MHRGPRRTPRPNRRQPRCWRKRVMGQITLHVNNRPYTLACRDGEEAQLVYLAAYVDDRISELVQKVGQVGEERLLLMTALLLADEMQEMQRGYGVVNADDAADKVTDAARSVEALVERLRQAS
ncbi:hypothetical protein CCR80_09075 [Rhodothalassium salexigens]|nr:hypothetical protein [Rhodothalassium salexigens]